MRWNRIQEVWGRIDEQVCSRWDLLSSADVEAIGGDRDTLLDTLCERYELPRDKANWQVSIWQNGYTDCWLYSASPGGDQATAARRWTNSEARGGDGATTPRTS